MWSLRRKYAVDITSFIMIVIKDMKRICIFYKTHIHIAFLVHLIHTRTPDPAASERPPCFGPRSGAIVRLALTV